jgi:uncharacterized glyoxalase superfamily protein PhnB
MSIINEFYQLKTFSETTGRLDARSDSRSVSPQERLRQSIIVTDVDAHYAQAIGAGAEIIVDIDDDKCGERSYSCRDLQGHIWNFSSYAPQNHRDWSEPIY